eukprot:1083168-Rhodomonas_salina.1
MSGTHTADAAVLSVCCAMRGTEATHGAIACPVLTYITVLPDTPPPTAVITVLPNTPSPTAVINTPVPGLRFLDGPRAVALQVHPTDQTSLQTASRSGGSASLLASCAFGVRRAALTRAVPGPGSSRLAAYAHCSRVGHLPPTESGGARSSGTPGHHSRPGGVISRSAHAVRCEALTRDVRHRHSL